MDVPFHPDIGFVAQRGRGLLRDPNKAQAQARRLSLRRGPASRDQPLPRRAQSAIAALRLDRRSRQNHRCRQARAPSVRFNPLGNSLFAAVFSDLGGALMDARKEEIHSNSDLKLTRRTSRKLLEMPLELLNREARWQDFFCRLMPLARQVRPASGLKPRPRVLVPHLLYVDAAATRGSMQVIGLKGLLESRRFRDLSSAVAAERAYLERLDGVVRLEHLAIKPNESLIDALERRLGDKKLDVPDIIHFTGHAISNGIGDTDLIFPSLSIGEVSRLSVESFAKRIPDGVQLIVLSACQGISSSTACRLHSEKGVAVLGFRWEVDANSAAKFLETFYKALLKDQNSFAVAYREACQMGDESKFAWAAAALLDHD
jgi:hypothetical protein